MGEYLSPGVFVEEVSSGNKPIEGVGTSTGAFVGRAVKGPVNKAILITNPTQFVDTFGGFHPDYYLAYAIRHFFTEGGTRCYVVRVFAHNSDDLFADVARTDLEANGTPVLRVLAVNEGEWGNSLAVEIGAPAFDPQANEQTPRRWDFSLKVYYRGEVVEAFTQLTMREFTTDNLPNPFHVEAQINGISKYIEVDDLEEDPDITDPPDTTLIVDDVPVLAELEDGTNGLLVMNATTLTGDPAQATGLYAFDVVDDINIVAIPDSVHPNIEGDRRQVALDGMTYCENRQDCFFVADAPSGRTPQEVLSYKRGTAPFSGNAFNSTYGALYYPWIVVADPLTGGRKLFPPSGAVVGTYSGTDVKRGVHKAPAGITDGFLNAAVDIERIVTKGEHDTLNPEGINVIRKFPEAGIVIWGARTVSVDPEWIYVNVRRLFLFLEESIEEGTQWVVFEPNDQTLWHRIRRNVSAFLRIQWLEGKLVGNKPEEAFFVKCDAETNPPESVDLGRVITLIGVAPSKPAEFVIFRISQERPQQ